jgi:mono/diheme cytochrome c family protein
MRPCDLELGQEDEMTEKTGARVLMILILAAAVPSAVAAPAQQTAEPISSGTSGDAVFKTYCGSCHGKSAKGDGPLADALRYRPADLTLIAKRNRGKFDAEKVYRMIDGRDLVKGHGGTDMPVWGDAFKSSGEGYSEKPVRARIQAIVDYLKSIQVR